MQNTTRATLIFPRSGQRIKVEVPAEQYEAVIRRNQELIRYFSPEQAARRTEGEHRRPAAKAA